MRRVNLGRIVLSGPAMLIGLIVIYAVCRHPGSEQTPPSAQRINAKSLPMATIVDGKHTATLPDLPTLAPPRVPSTPIVASPPREIPGGELIFLQVESDQTGIEVAVEDN